MFLSLNGPFVLVSWKVSVMTSGKDKGERREHDRSQLCMNLENNCASLLVFLSWMVAVMTRVKDKGERGRHDSRCDYLI